MLCYIMHRYNKLRQRVRVGIRRAVQCATTSAGVPRCHLYGNDEQLPGYCVLIWFNFTDFKTLNYHLCIQCDSMSGGFSPRLNARVTLFV